MLNYRGNNELKENFMKVIIQTIKMSTFLFIVYLFLYSSTSFAAHFKDVEPTLRGFFGDKVVFQFESIQEGESPDAKWKLKVNDKDYFVRFYSGDEKARFVKTSHLNKIFGDQGVAPKVHLIDEAKGILLTDFVKGRPLSQKEVRDPVIQKSIATLMHKIHHSKEGMDVVKNEMDRIEKVSRSLNELKSKGWELPPLLEPSIQKLLHLATLDQFKLRKALVHKDLHRENILIDENRKLWVIDWEAAQKADPYFDLVTFVFQSHFNEKEEDQFVRIYFKVNAGEDLSPHEKARYLMIKGLHLCRKAINAIMDFHGTPYYGRSLSSSEIQEVLEKGINVQKLGTINPVQVKLVRALRSLRQLLQLPEMQRVDPR